MKTEQETFDAVVAHFLTMDGPAIDPDSDDQGCRYRSPTGAKCFVGALIPDELYREEIETYPVKYDCVRRITESLGYLTTFLQELQEIHDNHSAEPADVWKGETERELIEFAARHGLKCSLQPQSSEAERSED